MKQLTTGDIHELTGIPPTTLSDWCAKGIIASRPQGTGQYRTFDTIDAVAIQQARLWAMNGCKAELLTKIVAYLTQFNEKQLLAEFKAGRKFLLVSPGGGAKLCKVPAGGDYIEEGLWLLDIERAYQHIKKRIQEIQAKRRKNSTGRNRGLVSG